jgi:hypothetical protein
MRVKLNERTWYGTGLALYLASYSVSGQKTAVLLVIGLLDGWSAVGLSGVSGDVIKKASSYVSGMVRWGDEMEVRRKVSRMVRGEEERGEKKGKERWWEVRWGDERKEAKGERRGNGRREKTREERWGGKRRGERSWGEWSYLP